VHQHVERAERGHFFQHTVGADVPAHECRLSAEGAQVFGGLLGGAVAAEVADRDAYWCSKCSAVAGEA